MCLAHYVEDKLNHFLSDLKDPDLLMDIAIIYRFIKEWSIWRDEGGSERTALWCTLSSF